MSFSVVWKSDEPSAPSIIVYDDTYTDIIDTLVITNESAVHNLAEDLGVMKVRVTNLALDTQYYFQTVTVSNTDGTTVTFPEITICRS